MNYRKYYLVNTYVVKFFIIVWKNFSSLFLKHHDCLERHEPHDDIDLTGVMSGAVTKAAVGLEEQELFEDISKDEWLVEMILEAGL